MRRSTRQEEIGISLGGPEMLLPELAAQGPLL